MQDNNNNLAIQESSSSFVFNPEPIDLTPQIMVGDVNLTDFIKTKQLVRTRKGVYELLNRSGNGRVAGSLTKLRDYFDELALVTDDDMDTALKTLGMGSEKKQDEEHVKAIAEAIDKFQIAFVADDNKYRYKSGLVYSTVVLEALQTSIEALNVPDGLSILKKQMRLKNRMFDSSGFSARPFDRADYNILNDRDRIIAQCMQVDLDKPVFNSAIDALFKSVAGGCDINKEVLEKSLLAKWYTTKVLANTNDEDYNNDYLLRKPPTFIFYAGGSAGRSLFFQQVCGMIFGAANCATITKSAGTDFNGDMLKKIIVFFNEVKNKDPHTLTEEFKTFIDNQINGVSKNKDGITIDNIGWYVLTSNGVGSVIIMACDLNKVDRRWQVVEGNCSLTDVLKEIGLVNAGPDEDSDTQDIVSRQILNKANLSSHIAWLYEKYSQELEKTDWKVNAVKSPAYFKLCEIQSAAWVKAHMVKYLNNFLTPDKPVILEDLHERYKVQEWFKEAGESSKTVLKFPKFKEHVINAVRTFNELREFVVYQQRKKIDGVNVRDVLTISEDKYQEWKDSDFGRRTDDDNVSDDDCYSEELEAVYDAARNLKESDNNIQKALDNLARPKIGSGFKM